MVTPINEFEAIIEPFWDPDLSGLKQWTIAPGQAHGLKVAQGWCFVTFDWERRPPDGPSLRMSRPLDVDCRGFDRLMVSLVAPAQAVLTVRAATDAGPRQRQFEPSDGAKHEYMLDLAGAGRISEIGLEIAAGADGAGSGWLNWIGLQDSTRLDGYLRRYDRHDAGWEQHLRPQTYKPKFVPKYGLVFSAQELEALRRRHQEQYPDAQASPFVIAGRAAAAVEPERLIGQYVNFWTDTRYNRERDHGRILLRHGLNAAVAGHLLQDPALLRLAARYALSIASCENWDDGFICYFPGSVFDHRCFVQSLCAYEVAAILDLAGEEFTRQGRDYLLRRLAEEGVGAIQYNTWRCEYIFGCNQLAWFSPGRILAMAVLEQHWPRLKAYRRIAYDELVESLDKTILSDGGYAEGPTYFRCVGRDAGLALYHHAKAEGKGLLDVAPPILKRCGDFAELLCSTDERSDQIPICDAGPVSEMLVPAVMTRILPDSAWARMLHKKFQDSQWVARSNIGGSTPSMLDQALAWQLAADVPATSVAPRSFVVMPEMGPMASTRRLGDQLVKVLVQGNKGGAGHTHEDKGSFVLEFAGATFAMDPGTCDYSNPLAGVLKHAQRHNMLLPAGISERPAPASPLPTDVKPVGQGDERSFHATIDLSPGWEKYYRLWRRTWDSPSPGELTITDEYELAQGDGVEFYWQTRLPIRLEAGGAVIEGQRGLARIQWPADCTARIDELPSKEGVQHRLAICKRGAKGSLTVHVTLQAR